MAEDYYRRPKRTHSSNESYAEKFNRYWLSKGPGELMRTVYPKDWKPKDKGGDIRTMYPSAKEREKNEKEKGLMKKLGIISAALLAGSVLFITPNFTGSIIWNMPPESTNMWGVVFFVLGILGLLFSLRIK